MSETVSTLLSKALALPPEQRQELLARLMDSVARPGLPEPPVRFASEEEAEAAWQAELALRLEEVEKHPERLLDGEQVMAELRARYRKADAP